MKKVIQESIHSSNFANGITDIFLYESDVDTNRIILLLKGIYGYHTVVTQSDTEIMMGKWDNVYIRSFVQKAHILCVNTSRLSGFDQGIFSQRRDSFEGKDYSIEVSDVNKALSRALEILKEKGITNPEIHLVGKSFGGTTFLGMAEFMHRAVTVSMLGSGCGKSDTTTKPLVRTLPDENQLLQTVRDYNGRFYYYRGTLDDLVPAESQEKIVNTSGAVLTSYIKIKGADHEFEKINGIDSPEIVQKLANIILNSIVSDF